MITNAKSIAHIIFKFLLKDFSSNILNLFTENSSDRHIWKIKIGKKGYQVQDVLNNYELLGRNKEEIRVYMEEYTANLKDPGKWIFLVKNTEKTKYELHLFFKNDRLFKVLYSYIALQ